MWDMWGTPSQIYVYGSGPQTIQVRVCLSSCFNGGTEIYSNKFPACHQLLMCNPQLLFNHSHNCSQISHVKDRPTNQPTEVSVCHVTLYHETWPMWTQCSGKLSKEEKTLYETVQLEEKTVAGRSFKIKDLVNFVTVCTLVCYDFL